RMPRKNGLEMIAESKKLVNFESIILTSYSHFDYAKEAINLGVSSYVLKPIDEKELLEIVKGIKSKIKDRKVVQNIKSHSNSEGELDFTNLKVYIDNDSTNTYVKHALEKIRKEYNEKISIEAIAEELLISPSYLSRKFKSATGYTFLDLLNKYRIQKSIDIILKEKGKYRVYEISDMVGFTDYKHYCTVFKKYTNLSPKEFIKGESVILK
ncbi:AraC family transcriptional regulator, partial [Clostridium sp.]|uniref:response regulator transcription factor n=1 Tax=Clostridium sp. TaxID=1506 RepID=UPI002635CE9E